MIEVGCYEDRSDNYGTNSLYTSFGGLKIYYSYHTPIVARYKGHMICRQNHWNQTTAKHFVSATGKYAKERRPYELDGKAFTETVNRWMHEVIADLAQESLSTQEISDLYESRMDEIFKKAA